MHFRRLALAGGLLAALAAAPAAEAQSGTYQYDVTVKAEMKDQWTFRDSADISSPGRPCLVQHNGDGSATWQLKSRRPKRVMVMKGFGGRPPALNVGTGEGVELTGAYKRQGSDVETHEGSCAAANPPIVKETSGCGVKSAGFDFNLAWKPAARNLIYPSAIASEPTEDCPSGPPWGVDWANDLSPSIMEATTQVSPRKFLGTKQFTVRGAKTFTGTVPTGKSRSGSQTVSWSWEATYRLVGGKKRKRR